MRPFSFINLALLLTALTCSVLTGCDSMQQSSSFAIQFTFPGDTWPEGRLWLTGRVEARTNPMQEGTTLSEASPVLLEPGASLNFNSVQFGESLVVVAEIRATESSNGRTLYSGVRPF